MAVAKAYRPNVDLTAATQVEVASSPVNAKTAFIPSTQLTDANNTAIGTAGNPLVVSTTAGGAGVTVTDRSITNMTGASQSVLTAGQGNGLIYMQALSSNVGTIWINLAGGTAVVGSGVPIAPGGYITVQPGIANAVTGIAASANDDLVVYAG
jgi:hypothetical protein